MFTSTHQGGPESSQRPRRRRFARMATVGVAAAIMITLAGGCGGGPRSNDSGVPTIRFALGSADVTAVYGPIYYTDANGFFERHGVNVETQHLSAQAGIPALINGDIDAIFVGKGVISAIADDGNGKVIASLGYNGLELWGSASVTSVEQLVGGTIAATTPGGVVDDAAKNTIADHGYTLGTDISIIYLQSVSASITALTAGQVQAAVLSPPATVMALSQGLHFLENVERAAAPGVLAVNGDFLAENHDAVEDFLRALREGYEAAATDKPGIVDALLAASPALERGLTEASVDRFATSWMVSAYPEDAARETLLENPATASVDVATVIDNQFIDAVGTYAPST
jgi:ABC-type nitrate/sulfonate/bicarbonate transport system substrate-binding protein